MHEILTSPVQTQVGVPFWAAFDFLHATELTDWPKTDITGCAQAILAVKGGAMRLTPAAGANNGSYCEPAIACVAFEPYKEGWMKVRVRASKMSTVCQVAFGFATQGTNPLTNAGEANTNDFVGVVKVNAETAPRLKVRKNGGTILNSTLSAITLADSTWYEWAIQVVKYENTNNTGLVNFWQDGVFRKALNCPSATPLPTDATLLSPFVYALSSDNTQPTIDWDYVAYSVVR